MTIVVGLTDLAALATEDPVVFTTGLVPTDAAHVFGPGQRVGRGVRLRGPGSASAGETHKGGGGRRLDQQPGRVRLHLEGALWVVEGV